MWWAVSALILGASIAVGACGSSASSPAEVSRVPGAHTFEIDTTWTGQGPPNHQRRLVDDDTHVGEIFPSTQDGGSSPEIVDGDTGYVDVTGDTCNGTVLPGARWQKVAVPKRGAAGARLTDPFDYPLTALSPSKALAELVPIVTAIRPDGKATIDGVSTTRFDLTVSSSEMAAFMFGSQEDFSGDATLRFGYEMWVDDDNRLRQSQITVMTSGQSSETVTNVYSHFGVPVDVTIPPVSEVIPGSNC